MNLENCGRCGLEPGEYGCPIHGHGEVEFNARRWNTAQFGFRTERINAAAVAIWAGMVDMVPKDSLTHAVDLIAAQDAATRARWAEMQGEE